jgi:hypothetical protein
VPQRVREPDQRGVLLHPAVGPRGRDDQQEAEVGDRRWSRRRCCSLSIVERAEKRGADVGRRRGAGRNILKCFSNKSENLFNHSEHYEVFSSIFWELFVNIFSSTL